MIEGRGSNRALALSAAQSNEPWFRRLMERLVASSIEYLLGQIAAGAEALQIFDSWAGDLPVELRGRCVHDPIAAIGRGVRKVHPEVPIIVFGRGIGMGHAELARATGANAVSVEHGVAISEVLASLPKGVAVQGNLSPEVVMAGGEPLSAGVLEICRVPMGQHIFNLGHGIPQHTPPENVTELLKVIREHDGGKT